MGNLNAAAAAPGANDMQAFFNNISDINQGIDQLNGNISKIEGLHDQILNAVEDDNVKVARSQLDTVAAETSALNATLVRKIRDLKSKHRDQQQATVVERKFKESLNRYQQVEKVFKDRTREAMIRQYRVVAPEGTSDEEIRQAVEDGDGQQIFSSAVCVSIIPPV